MAALSNEHNIPCVITYYRKKNPVIHGSKNLKKEAEKLVTNEPRWKMAMKQDLEDLTSYTENNGEMVDNFDEARMNKEPPPLQRPWNLMAHNHSRSYLINCIMTSYWRKGGTRPRIQYFHTAGLEMKPEWWLEEELPWHLLTNVCKKLNYTGPGNFASFCKRSIQACFNHHGWSVEAWPYIQLDNKKLVDAKRQRGIRGLKYEETDEEGYAQMDDGKY